MPDNAPDAAPVNDSVMEKFQALNVRMLELLKAQIEAFFENPTDDDIDMINEVLGLGSSESLLKQLTTEQKAELTKALVEKLDQYVKEYDLSDLPDSDFEPIADLFADIDVVKEYFAAHPEVFATILRELLNDSGALENVDLSPSVEAELTPARVSAFLKLHPEIADSILSKAIGEATRDVPPHVRVTIETAVFNKSSLEAALKAYPDLAERAWVNALTGSGAGGQSQLVNLIQQNQGFRDVFAKALAEQAKSNITELTKNAVETLVIGRLEDRKHGLGLKSMICRFVLWLIK